MKTKVALISLASVVAFVAALITAKRSPVFQALRGNWDFVKSATRDTGTYYRLKVKLSYRGEAQDFDIVVGCDVRQTNYMDGGRTVEIGLTPSVFGRRMDDGRGLVVRPPRACRDETTENGGVPPDLLPVVVVYDDAETLAFGTAYLSDDAYESPLSVLQFGGATIERADRAAFDQFRREQHNLVSRSSYHMASGVAALNEKGLSPARVPMGLGCYGYARFRLVGARKERVHEVWPADRPQFWKPVNAEEQEAIDPLLYGRPMQTDHEDAVTVPSNRVLYNLEFDVPDKGLPRRHPAKWGKGDRVVAPSYYPDMTSWSALPWPADPVQSSEDLFREGPNVGASIDFRNGATRGFGYCMSLPRTLVPSGPASFRYLGISRTHLVNAIEVRNRSSDWGGERPLIVERDEFMFQPFVFSLPSFRGDV